MKEFAKFRNKGELLKLIVDGFGIDVEEVSGLDKKSFERFVKEENISLKEYYRIHQKVLELVFSKFNLNEEQKNMLEFAVEIYEDYYNRFTLLCKPYGVSQKFLDYLVALFFAVPFFSKIYFALNKEPTLNSNLLQTLRQILPSEIQDSMQIFPSEKQNGIQNAFMFLARHLDLEKVAKENPENKRLIDFDILNFVKRKLKENLLSQERSVDYWFSGKQIPKPDALESIADVLKDFVSLKKEQILNLLLAARAFSLWFEWAKRYFGEELSVALAKHFVIMCDFSQFQILLNFSFSTLEYWADELPSAQKFIVKQYLLFVDEVFKANYFVALQKQTTDVKCHPEVVEAFDISVRETSKFFEIFFRKGEEEFFSNLEYFVPVSALFRDMLAPDVSYAKIYKKTSENEEAEILNRAQKREERKKEFSKQFERLSKRVEPREKKQNKEAVFLELSKFAESFEERTPEKIHANFLLARYYAQCLELEKSSEIYLSVAKEAKGRLGVLYKKVLKEGLFVSAMCCKTDELAFGLDDNKGEAKTDFVKFVKAASLAGLLDEPTGDVEILTHAFLNDCKKRFEMHFPKLFIDKKEKKRILSVVNSSFSSYELVKKFKPNLENPNSYVENSPFPTPIRQLSFAANMGRLDYVKALIEHGADVNFVNPHDNSTALIGAFNVCFPAPLSSSNYEVAKFLIPLMSSEALSAVTLKKKVSAMFFAVTHELVELVEMLVLGGVDLTKKASIEQFTPLYLTLCKISFAKFGKEWSRIARHTFREKSMRVLKELIKQANYQWGDGVFKDEKMQAFLRANTGAAQESIERMGDQLDEIALECTDLEKLRKIAHILIDAVKDVNFVESNGFTALIFATEIEEFEIVKHLLDKGADKTYRMQSGKSAGKMAYDYASDTQILAMRENDTKAVEELGKLITLLRV